MRIWKLKSEKAAILLRARMVDILNTHRRRGSYLSEQDITFSYDGEGATIEIPNRTFGRLTLAQFGDVCKFADGFTARDEM